MVVATLAGCGGSSGPSAGSGTTAPSDKARATVGASTPATAVRAGRIVFRRFAEGSEHAASLFVSNTDGSDERRLTDGAAKGLVDDEPSWSPDGKQVVFSRLFDAQPDREWHRVAVVSADGTGLHYLTPGIPAKDGNIVGFDGTPAFSPDGSQIAYLHAQGVVKDDQIPHTDVMVMSTDGSHKRGVTHIAAFAGGPAGMRWSPDGKRLVYSFETSGTGKPANSLALFVIGVDGSGQRQLTPWALGAGGIPAWSTSGLIAFRAVTNEESGVGNFYTIRPDGTGLTQVTHFVGQTISHQVGVSPDGQWLVFSKRDGTDGPNFLMIARLGSTDLYKVGDGDRIGSAPDWDPTS
jgi:Tol biopolymer transport system component